MEQSQIDAWLKKYPCTILESGNIRTCPVRLSYPALFKPAPPMQDGGKHKYGAALLFPNGADLSVLDNEAVRICKENWPGKKVKHWARDQGEKDDRDGYEAGAKFTTCNSDNKPVVLDRAMNHVTEESGAIYPGVWVIATIRAFPNKHPTNLGPRFGLQGVQKFADDETFSSRGNPVEDFVPLEDDMDASDADAVMAQFE